MQRRPVGEQDVLVAVAIVAVELWVISYVRHKYMDTPFLQATFQVVVGGVLVFLTGWLIGAAVSNGVIRPDRFELHEARESSTQ